MNLVGPLLLQFVLILLNAVFATAEIAVISISEAKLQKLEDEGDKRARRLAKLKSQPAKFLATIQVAITLSGFMGSAFAAENFSGYFVSFFETHFPSVSSNVVESCAVVVITLILAYLSLIFGELVPKRIAMRKTESAALGLSATVYGVSKAFAPVVWFLTVSTNAVLRLIGIDPDADDEEVSEEDILMMAEVGSEKGVIEEETNTQASPVSSPSRTLLSGSSVIWRMRTKKAKRKRSCASTKDSGASPAAQALRSFPKN